MNVKKRDEILFGEYIPDRYGPRGNYAPYFKDLPLEQVEKLVEHGYLDLEMNQNGSPTTREFMDYMKMYPDARVSGFATCRPSDTDVVITTVSIRTDISVTLAEFAARFHDADEFSIYWDTANNMFDCRAWWD